VIVDLGDGRRRSGLRAALAQALGDPGLSIGFRAAAADGWVDEFGGPFTLPSAGDGSSVTVVRDGDEAIAALVHDPAALADDGVAASVTAAVRLALANVRLQDEVTAQVRDVAASGRRLVEAGDDERRRLAQQVRDGPEPRLLALATRLSALAASRGEAADDLLQLSDRVASAREDVLHFAQGVHPRALTEGDLGAALAQLAASATLDVSVSTPVGRVPPAQEAAAFFVCSEALANAAKHSGAGHVTIRVTEGDGRLCVLVDDDGAGGADPARGSGLRGLVDRVEALGGTLRVDSPRGGGTRLEAQLPIGSAGGR
jgi:signal transduction histidine kinase